jgi:hypothetical protein
MSLDELFTSLHDSAIGAAIRSGANAFPWIESIHVLAITTVVGTIAIIDLRLLGVAAHKRSIRLLMLELLPITWTAFALAVVAGSLMFVSNAVMYAHNTQFRIKMLLILLAGINMLFFHFVTQRNLALWDEITQPPWPARLAGAVSLSLWIGVVFFARWTGFTLI